MILLRSWREFIEVYVQSSPNRPVAYIKSVASKNNIDPPKRHDSLESRDSDDDSPGTPKALSHSKSQLSGSYFNFVDFNLFIYLFVYLFIY